MHIRPDALSADGYLIDQRKTDNIQFGPFPSSQNGCGWIAVYNFLKALDRDPDPELLVERLERSLLWGGRLGVNFFALVWELRRQNLPLRFAVRPFHAQCLSESCRAGIVFYRTGTLNHFVAFRREENGRLRFFGVIPGQSHHEETMAEFYWNHVKFPLAVTITTT